MADERATPRHTNRLIDETSPYLLQHAHNPVDWRPWGPEVFEQAKREDKPIFLSVGYSTCHWCHVMERESFEDEETAELLNRGFVSVKVDRAARSRAGPSSPPRRGGRRPWRPSTGSRPATPPCWRR